MRKLLILFAVLLLLLTACSTDSPAEADFFAMDTLMNVKIWGSDAQDALSAVSQRINNISARMSTESGELYALNRDGSAQVAEDFVSLLNQAIVLSERTNGLFDPTIYPLVHLWGFTTDEYHVPTIDELTSAKSYLGTQHITLDGATVTLDGGTQLDFGAIAKGWSAEQCKQLLSAYDITAALLALGGNVQTIGTKPDGSNWIIGITDPENPSGYIAKLCFSGTMSVVTSGSYQRYFEQGGTRYHHILDPATGASAQSGLLSVTVLADDGALADALSTALFVMGLEDGADFWRASDDFEAVFITDTGEIYATPQAAAFLSDCEYTVITR